MMDRDVLAFVEVKTKRGLQFGSPEEMFTQAKQAQVRRMAEVYLHGRQLACRIDLVTVLLGPDISGPQIRHYPNVG